MSNFENTKKSNPHAQSAYIKQTPTGEWGPHIWVDAPPSDGQNPAKTATQNAYTKTTPSEDGWAEHTWVKKIIKEGGIEGFGKWTLDEDGLLTIDGNGFLSQVVSNQLPYKGVTAIKINDGITEIGEAAFRYSDAKHIFLPNSLLCIGGLAFMNSDLEEIIIPSSVIIIRPDAFWNCRKLKKVVMPTRFNKTILYRGLNIFSPLESWGSFENYHGIPKRIVTFKNC